jgi:hypothetical protein
MNYPKLNNFNEMYTPREAMQYIIPFLDKTKIYYEMCYWQWHMAKWLEEEWYKVVWDPLLDCFEDNNLKYDFIITNPPFNWNKKFLKRAIDLWKPFAFLQRLEHLWGVEALKLFKDLKIQIIIPEKRINYITPKVMQWKNVWWSPFHSIWITYWLNLSNDILWVNKK